MLLVVLFFMRAVAFAQHNPIENPGNLAPFTNDTNRIDCLNALSYKYIILEKKDSAEYFATLACKEAQKINYIHGIAVAYSRQSQIAKHFDDDFIKSETLGKTSLQWYEKTGNKEGIDTLYNYLIYTVFSQSRFEEAIDYTEKKYAFAKQSDNLSKTMDALTWMFAIYRQRGMYEKSFQFARQRYDLALQSKNKIWISTALYGMAQLYMLIEDYPDALSYFRRVLQMDDQETIHERISTDNDIWFKMEFTEVFSHLKLFDSAWHYYNLFKPASNKAAYFRVYWVSTGECYLLQKDYNRALQNFQLGLKEHQKLNDRNEVMRTLLDIGKTWLALGDDKAALQYARDGLQIALTTKTKQFIRDGYQVLYSVFDRWHQTDSANFYFRKYTAMKDLVANDQIKAKFAAYKYDQQIELLNTEKQLQQERLRQTTTQKEFLIVIIVGIVLLVPVLLRNFFLKRKNETHRRKIAESELQLQKLEVERAKAAFQKQAADLEMQALRAQMNPHFIFNSLNSINCFILKNDKLQASAYLTKFSKLIRLILQNSQSAFITLENELDALQLYLELEAVRFDQQFSYGITTAGLDVAIIKVPPLIIQPYVENAIWHGLMLKEEKGHLEINLFTEDTTLYCKITDDGIGRQRAKELGSRSSRDYKSMGMHITAERITMLQHKKQLDTVIEVTDLAQADEHSGGTEVLLKIPLLYD
ncbi:Tetratricopeptide repeat-containing protein [Niastella yeongjuensis]|nr:Tetratricopeptide repeat-containing protein [Niastella yeongjuensis]